MGPLRLLLVTEKFFEGKKSNLDQGGISGTILAGTCALNVLILKRTWEKK